MKGTCIWSVQLNIRIKHYVSEFLAPASFAKMHVRCSIRKQNWLTTKSQYSILPLIRNDRLKKKKGHYELWSPTGEVTHANECKVDCRRLMWSCAGLGWLAIWSRRPNSSDFAFGQVQVEVLLIRPLEPCTSSGHGRSWKKVTALQAVRRHWERSC